MTTIVVEDQMVFSLQALCRVGPADRRHRGEPARLRAQLRVAVRITEPSVRHRTDMPTPST